MKKHLSLSAITMITLGSAITAISGATLLINQQQSGGAALGKLGGLGLTVITI